MIYFVGAGSGDKELITVKGKSLLENADAVIYAGSLVNEELLEYTKKPCKIFNSAYMTLEEVMEKMICFHNENKLVVRLHTGDPSLYGAIREQIDELRRLNIPFEVVPGVSSFLAAAASLEAEYTLPGVSQSLIITRMAGRCSVPEKESIESFSSHGCSMAIFLSSSMTKELRKSLLAGGYKKETPAAIVYKASWREEKKILCTVDTLTELAEKNVITKTALILVGDFLKSSSDFYEKSKLYDKSFSTEFRKAVE